MIGKISSVYNTSSAAIKANAGSVLAITCTSTGSGGTVALKDGGSGGTTIWQVGLPANCAPIHAEFPGDGLHFDTSIYVSLSNAYAAVCYN